MKPERYLLVYELCLDIFPLIIRTYFTALFLILGPSFHKVWRVYWKPMLISNMKLFFHIKSSFWFNWDIQGTYIVKTSLHCLFHLNKLSNLTLRTYRKTFQNFQLTTGENLCDIGLGKDFLDRYQMHNP